MSRPNATDCRRAMTDLRKQITRCGQTTTYAELANQAEVLQHMAFDLKDMVIHGGSWAERQAEGNHG